MNSLADRLDHLLRRALGAVLAVLLALLAGLCFVAVVLRYGFGTGLDFYDEFAGYLLVWLTFLGAALAQRDRRHIGLESLVERLGPRGRWRLDLAAQLSLAAVQVVLVVYGVVLAARFTRENAITLPVPMGALYAVVPVSALLVIVFQLIEVTRTLDRR